MRVRECSIKELLSSLKPAGIELMERSVDGQVELWARLGQALEPMWDGTEVLTLNRTAQELAFPSCLETVDTAG